MLKSASTKTVYQLLVTLREVEPSVYRRLEVEDCCLSTLHRIIQAAMGWQDCHMHCFEIGDQKYTSDEAIGDLGWSNDDSTKLGEIVAEGHDSFIYTYDMGDHWDHTIKIEKTATGKPSARYPRCTGGKRTCPPEDCGGVPGYQEFILAICDPKHEQHDEMLEWVGGKFDPTAFDREEINRELRRVR